MVTTRSNFGNVHITPIVIDFSAPGDNIIVPAPAGAAIELYQIYLVLGADSTGTFKAGVGGVALSGPLPMLANGSIVLDFSGAAWHETTPGNSLVLNSSSGVQISGTAYYMVK